MQRVSLPECLRSYHRCKEGGWTLSLPGKAWGGAWWRARSKLTDSDLKTSIQIVSDTYPTPVNLKLWGMQRDGKCAECCHPWGNMGHIQGHSYATQEERIACYNQCRELVTEIITTHAKGWLTYPEATCESTLHIMMSQLTGILIQSMPTVNFRDPKEVIRDLEWEEARMMRINELAIHIQSKRLWYNEMTRGWDQEADFHVPRMNLNESGTNHG